MDKEKMQVYLRPSWMNRQHADSDTLLHLKWEQFINNGNITPQFISYYLGTMKRSGIFSLLEKVEGFDSAGFFVEVDQNTVGEKNKQFYDVNPDFESDIWKEEYCLENAPPPTEQVVAFIYSAQHQSLYAVRCRWRPDLSVRSVPGLPAPYKLFFERVQYPILINERIWPTKPIHSDRDPDNHPLIIGDVICIHNQYYRIRANKPTSLRPADSNDGVLPGLKLTRVLAHYVHEITQGEETE